ncbi:hypothetical protein VCJ_000850 [Vibrio metoecus]|nr:hypothetical protein VCJ_000850 [Vibrio metoecus]
MDSHHPAIPLFAYSQEGGSHQQNKTAEMKKRQQEFTCWRLE